MITVAGKHIDIEDLKQFEIIRPKRAGDRWQGVAHYDLATALQKAMWGRGLKVTQSVWAVDGAGQSLVGALNVDFPSWMGIEPIEGMSYSLGIRHTNNMRYAVTIAVGTQIFVCNNGLISGEFVLNKKHTTGLNLQQAMRDGVSRFIEEARLVQDCVERLKRMHLRDRQVCRLLVEAGRRKILAWSHIGMVDAEYRKPRYQDFAGRTGWSLYNALTEVAKKSSPARQMSAMNQFRELILN